MATDKKRIEIRKDLSIKKESFSPVTDARESAQEEAPGVDADALQEAIGQRRRLGGAENRSDEEDLAMASVPDAPYEAVDPVEIEEEE